MSPQFAVLPIRVAYRPTVRAVEESARCRDAPAGAGDAETFPATPTIRAFATSAATWVCRGLGALKSHRLARRSSKCTGSLNIAVRMSAAATASAEFISYGKRSCVGTVRRTRNFARLRLGYNAETSL